MSDQEMACKELVELITEYLENTLTDADRQRFEQHLEDCVDCTVYLDQMRKTIVLTGHLRESDISPQAREALVGVFGVWREQEI